MAEETDNLSLNDEQRTRLLSLCLETAAIADEIDADELRGDLLCDILRCPLRLDERRPSTTGRIPQELNSVSQHSVSQLITDANTDVMTLRRIKEHAKALGESVQSETEKDACLALYFAAIAKALVFHNELISTHSRHDLTQFFGMYSDLPWMRADLRKLFAQAITHQRPND